MSRPTAYGLGARVGCCLVLVEGLSAKAVERSHLCLRLLNTNGKLIEGIDRIRVCCYRTEYRIGPDNPLSRRRIAAVLFSAKKLTIVCCGRNIGATRGAEFGTIAQNRSGGIWSSSPAAIWDLPPKGGAQ